eukprot:Gb_02736 [translate_table: standard]
MYLEEPLGSQDKHQATWANVSRWIGIFEYLMAVVLSYAQVVKHDGSDDFTMPGKACRTDGVNNDLVLLWMHGTFEEEVIDLTLQVSLVRWYTGGEKCNVPPPRSGRHVTAGVIKVKRCMHSTHVQDLVLGGHVETKELEAGKQTERYMPQQWNQFQLTGGAVKTHEQRLARG